jgi:hypothetical protein
VDDASIRRPPRRNKPRERTLPDGTQVKWCPKCGKWGDHFRAGHTAANDDEDNGGDAANVATGDDDDNLVVQEDDNVSDGAFARLRMAGLF